MRIEENKKVALDDFAALGRNDVEGMGKLITSYGFRHDVARISKQAVAT